MKAERTHSETGQESQANVPSSPRSRSPTNEEPFDFAIPSAPNETAMSLNIAHCYPRGANLVQIKDRSSTNTEAKAARQRSLWRRTVGRIVAAAPCGLCTVRRSGRGPGNVASIAIGSTVHGRASVTGRASPLSRPLDVWAQTQPFAGQDCAWHCAGIRLCVNHS